MYRSGNTTSDGGMFITRRPVQSLSEIDVPVAIEKMNDSQKFGTNCIELKKLSTLIRHPKLTETHSSTFTATKYLSIIIYSLII